MVGFIADQSPKLEAMHHWTTFLNHETSFFTGAEKIGRSVGGVLLLRRHHPPSSRLLSCRSARVAHR